MEINEHFETVCDSRKETRGQVLQLSLHLIKSLINALSMKNKLTCFYKIRMLYFFTKYLDIFCYLFFYNGLLGNSIQRNIA
ncbi:MAG: hypothetical protein ACD_79C00869G0002 [uncultured bacterium]|nr:MAG: hypothetical protein ACD_79C00869G0002 [uncultured bacterium]